MTTRNASECVWRRCLLLMQQKKEAKMDGRSRNFDIKAMRERVRKNDFVIDVEDMTSILVAT